MARAGAITKADTAAFQEYAKNTGVEATAQEMAKWRKSGSPQAVAEEAPVDSTTTQAAAFDEQAYQAQLMAEREAMINRQLAATEGQLSKAYQIGKSQIEGERTGVERNYEVSQEQITQGSFDALQTQKALGAQRGLTPTGVQAAREQGVLREEMSLQAQAQQQRIDDLAAIDRRISELTIGYQADLQMARTDAALGREEALISSQREASDRALELQMFNEQLSYQQARDIQAHEQAKELVALNHQNATTMQEKQFSQDLMKMDISYDQQLNMFNLQSQFEREINMLDFEQQKALSQIDYNNQVNLMGMSHANQVEILGMEKQWQEHFFQMETATQERFMNMEQQDKLEVMALDQKYQEKMFMLSAEREDDLIADSIAREDFVWQREIDLQNEREMRDFTLDYITSNPEFAMHPEYTATFWNAGDTVEQMELLGDYLTVVGFDQQTQYDISKPLYDYHKNRAKKLSLPLPPSLGNNPQTWAGQMSNWLTANYVYENE